MIEKITPVNIKEVLKSEEVLKLDPIGALDMEMDAICSIRNEEDRARILSIAEVLSKNANDPEKKEAFERDTNKYLFLLPFTHPNVLEDITLKEFFIKRWQINGLHKPGIKIGDIYISVEDRIILKDSPSNLYNVLGGLSGNNIIIKEKNTSERYSLSPEEFCNRIDLNETKKIKAANKYVANVKENINSNKDDIMDIINNIAKDIKNESIKQKFIFQCEEKLLKYPIVKPEQPYEKCMDVILKIYESFNLHKNSVTVRGRTMYINSLVALKNSPLKYNLIISDITEDAIVVQHKYRPNDFKMSYRIENFEDELCLVYDIFKTQASKLKWDEKMYKKEYLACLLAEDVLTFKESKKETSSIRYKEDIYLEGITEYLEDRVKHIPDRYLAGKYIESGLAPLAKNASYTYMRWEEGSIIDVFDKEWDNSNISKKCINLGGKFYYEGESYIGIKGYTGVMELIVSEIEEDYIRVEHRFKSDVYNKRFSSIEELKKCMWTMEDIKNIENEYIENMDKFKPNELLLAAKNLRTAQWNFGYDIRRGYIDNLTSKLYKEISNRCHTDASNFSKQEILSIILDSIHKDSRFEPIIENISDNKLAISRLKKVDYSKTTSLYNASFGKIESSSKGFLFKRFDGFEILFSFQEIYQALFDSVKPNNHTAEESDLKKNKEKILNTTSKKIIDDMRNSNNANDIKNHKGLTQPLQKEINPMKTDTAVNIEKITKENVADKINTAIKKEQPLDRKIAFKALIENLYHHEKNAFEYINLSNKNNILEILKCNVFYNNNLLVDNRLRGHITKDAPNSKFIFTEGNIKYEFDFMSVYTELVLYKNSVVQQVDLFAMLG